MSPSGGISSGMPPLSGARLATCVDTDCSVRGRAAGCVARRARCARRVRIGAPRARPCHRRVAAGFRGGLHAGHQRPRRWRTGLDATTTAQAISGQARPGVNGRPSARARDSPPPGCRSWVKSGPVLTGRLSLPTRAAASGLPQLGQARARGKRPTQLRQPRRRLRAAAGYDVLLKGCGRRSLLCSSEHAEEPRRSPRRMARRVLLQGVGPTRSTSMVPASASSPRARTWRGMLPDGRDMEEQLRRLCPSVTWLAETVAATESTCLRFMLTPP